MYSAPQHTILEGLIESGFALKASAHFWILVSAAALRQKNGCGIVFFSGQVIHVCTLHGINLQLLNAEHARVQKKWHAA